MKFELACAAVALVVMLLSIPEVRGAASDLLPRVEDNDDCGKIVCSTEEPSRQSNAPDMRLKRD